MNMNAGRPQGKKGKAHIYRSDATHLLKTAIENESKSVINSQNDQRGPKKYFLVLSKKSDLFKDIV